MPDWAVDFISHLARPAKYVSCTVYVSGFSLSPCGSVTSKEGGRASEGWNQATRRLRGKQMKQYVFFLSLRFHSPSLSCLLLSCNTYARPRPIPLALSRVSLERVILMLLGSQLARERRMALCLPSFCLSRQAKWVNASEQPSDPFNARRGDVDGYLAGRPASELIELCQTKTN